jgi:hypothetical protein
MRPRKIKRFPRYHFSSRDRMAEKIIRLTFNSMAKARNIDRRIYHIDVYETKRGRDAQLTFLLLGQKLNKAGIDPALFIKVCGKYGAYKHARYMPHPNFFLGDKAWEVFQWRVKSEQRKYPKREDLLQSQGLKNDQDVLDAVRDSARIFSESRSSHHPDVVLAAIKPELSNWFVAAFLLSRKGWVPVRECMKYFTDNKILRREAREILKHSGVLS